MKRKGSIFILLVFCFYSFVFKTHYCYYADTDIRFHGDCNHEIKDAAAKGELAKTNFFPKHYVCDDYYKDANPSISKLIIVKNSIDGDAFVPHIIQNEIKGPITVHWLIPDIKNRAGPILIPNSLRGPPIC
jgi:hypothetical protein